MDRSSIPPGPQILRTRPMVGARSLDAEHASWRLHLALRGRDFEDERALQQFVRTQGKVLSTPLPSDATRVDRAQALFYESREATSHLLAMHMRKDALALDPENVDVLVDQALEADFEARLARLTDAVVLGDALAAAVVRDAEDEDRSWAVLSARPALRARAARTLHLVELGRIEEAIESCTQLLRLDPSDHQGARYLHISLLVEAGRYEDARQALDAHGEESSPIFAWAEVLLAWATDGDAEAALEIARLRNKYVEALLLMPDVLEVPPPEVHAAGSPEEAEIVCDLLWRAWYERPSAVDWLRERTHDDLCEVSETPVWELMLEADEEELRTGLLPFLLPRKDAVTERLRGLLAEGPDLEMPHLAEWASLLLRRLGTAVEAVPDLVAYLGRYASSEYWDESEASKTLRGVGDVAVPFLLAEYAEATDPRVRYDLAATLAGCGVQSEEVFAVLCEQFQADAVAGAGLMTDYGDVRALPLLSARLDRADADPKNQQAGVPDLLDAIEALGGSLTASQEERFAEFLEKRAQWQTPEGERELDKMILRIARKHGIGESSAREEPALGQFLESPLGGTGDDLTRPPPSVSHPSRRDRPGRNEPCWCGSGRKYKRCHLPLDDTESP